MCWHEEEVLKPLQGWWHVTETVDTDSLRGSACKSGGFTDKAPFCYQLSVSIVEQSRGVFAAAITVDYGTGFPFVVNGSYMVRAAGSLEGRLDANLPARVTYDNGTILEVVKFVTEENTEYQLPELRGTSTFEYYALDGRSCEGQRKQLGLKWLPVCSGHSIARGQVTWLMLVTCLVALLLAP